MYQFLLQLHAQGLGHEAVIEIMIALLGVMLTVLAILVAIIGWFGYTAIRDEAVKRAKQEARRVAKEEADAIYKRYEVRSRGAEYAADQKDFLRDISHGHLSGWTVSDATPDPPIKKPAGKKRKATKDQNLDEEESQ